MLRRSRSLTLLIGLPVALALAGCGGDPAPEETTVSEADAALNDATTEDLVAQATEEGTVNVYAFTSRIAQIEEAFEAEYPGIDVVAQDMESTEQISRLSAEAEAGTATADVAYISDAPVVFEELVQAGVLQQYVPARVADLVPEEYQSPLLANRISTKVLMYNEEAHPDGSPVENLWQLTEEEWNGKVVTVDPTVRGDYLDLMTEIVLRSDEMAEAYEQHFGEEIQLDDDIQNAGEQWIRDLYGNGLVLVDDTDAVNAAIGETGQEDPPVGFTSYSDRRDNEDEGWALQASVGTTPATGITFPALLGVVEGAENPAAARLLIDFMMGDETETGGPGFEPFYVAGDYPTRTDVVAPGDAVSEEELAAWRIDTEATVEIRDDVADFILIQE